MKEEIQKQLNVCFISVVQYLEWLANVVPVPKRDSKVRISVDFRNLNKASPRMIFLSHILTCWLIVLQGMRCCLLWKDSLVITKL